MTMCISSCIAECRIDFFAAEVSMYVVVNVWMGACIMVLLYECLSMCGYMFVYIRVSVKMIVVRYIRDRNRNGQEGLEQV